jgi:hypothetical protein
LQEALNSLVGDVMFQVLEEYNVPKKTVIMIKGLYEGLKCHEVHEGKVK